MPLPLTSPNTSYRSSNMPALCLKLRQPCFDHFSCLLVTGCGSGNSSDELPMLAVNLIVVARESRISLPLPAAIGSCRLCPPLQLSDLGKNAQVCPDS